MTRGPSNVVPNSLMGVMGVDGRDHGHSGIMHDRVATRREALAWRDRGYSAEWVAAYLGLPRRTVRRWFG